MFPFAEGLHSKDRPEKQVANVIRLRQCVPSCSKAAKCFHVAFMGNKWWKARRDCESPSTQSRTDLALLEYRIPFFNLHSIRSILSFPAWFFSSFCLLFLPSLMQSHYGKCPIGKRRADWRCSHPEDASPCSAPEERVQWVSVKGCAHEKRSETRWITFPGREDGLTGMHTSKHH